MARRARQASVMCTALLVHLVLAAQWELLLARTRRWWCIKTRLYEGHCSIELLSKREERDDEDEDRVSIQTSISKLVYSIMASVTLLISRRSSCAVKTTSAAAFGATKLLCNAVTQHQARHNLTHSLQSSSRSRSLTHTL